MRRETTFCGFAAHMVASTMTTGSKKRGWTALDPPSFREAGEGVRTLDIQLGRLTLYQLSYTRRAMECNTN